MGCIQDGWDFVYQLVIADRAHQKAALRVMWNHPRLLSPEAFWPSVLPRLGVPFLLDPKAVSGLLSYLPIPT